jgi:hypothetical protein
VTKLRAGRSEVGIAVWAGDFSLVTKRPGRLMGPHSPIAYSIVTEIIAPRAKRWGVQLMTHPYPVPRLMHGTMQLLLYRPSWRAKGKLYHYIYLYLNNNNNNNNNNNSARAWFQP